MRIAVVTHYFPTSKDPWAGHSAYQTLRLLAGKHEIHVFYPESVYPAILTPPGRKGKLDRAWRPGEVEVSYLPYPTLPVISRPLNGFVIARHLMPHVRRWRPEIVLDYVIYPDGYAAVRMARALGVPAVLTAIGSDLNRIPDPLCRALTRSTLRQADCVTTVSQDLYNTARRLGAPHARSQAILNGCDTAIFHPADRAEARRALGLEVEAEIVLYVGRLDLRKGILELVEAVSLLQSSRPRLRCLLIGGGPDEPRVREAIARHDLAERVTLVPACRTAQVAQWMAAADLVTLPSYNEGCPNVVLEALSAGRPVVATNVGGIPELMDTTCGALVPAREVAALAGALDRTLARSWDAAAISSQRSRSWSDVAADLERVLQETLAAAASS